MAAAGDAGAPAPGNILSQLQMMRLKREKTEAIMSGGVGGKLVNPFE